MRFCSETKRWGTSTAIRVTCHEPGLSLLAGCVGDELWRPLHLLDYFAGRASASQRDDTKVNKLISRRYVFLLHPGWRAHSLFFQEAVLGSPLNSIFIWGVAVNEILYFMN